MDCYCKVSLGHYHDDSEHCQWHITGTGNHLQPQAAARVPVGAPQGWIFLRFGGTKPKLFELRKSFGKSVAKTSQKASEKASQKASEKCRKSVAKVSQKCRKKRRENVGKTSGKRRKSVDHGFVQGLRSCPCSSFVACFDERFASTFAC